MERKDVVRDLVQAIGEFNSRRLWRWFTNSDCFGVRMAGQEELILGVVLGHAGEEYGLSLFRGPDAAASFARLLDSEGRRDDVLEDMDVLGFSMEEFGNLPLDAQRLWREGGKHPRHDEPAGHLLAKPPRCRPRLPKEPELSLLLLVLGAVVKADTQRLLQPSRPGDADGVCVLNIRGEASSPHVTVTWGPLDAVEGPTTIPLVPWKPNVEDLPRLHATWLVGMSTIPAGIQGDERIMQVLLVVDEASEYVLQGQPVLGGDLQEALEIMAETFRSGGLKGQKGVPRRIVFSSRRLYEAMAPVLEGVGVKCTHQPLIPELERVMVDLVAHMGRERPPLRGDTEADAPIPASDDLKGWKEADLRLYRRLAEDFRSSGQLRSSRAVKRYFRDDDLEFYLEEHEQRGVGPAYAAWAILDYRPNRGSKTHAEKMLAKGLPPAESVLLRARMAAWATLYRVAAHDPKTGTIDLEDVLLGGLVTVHDQRMSESIEDSLFLAARVFPAGRFRFIEMAGPPLAAGMGLEAVVFLRECGMEFTPEGLRQDAHMFGWLWQWVDQWQAARTSARLCNTDGEELLWHTASFSVADPEETRKTLMQREDIECDQEAGELVWSKPTGRGKREMGDAITLGQMEFVGDELVVTVNSAERLARARRWLEGLPGVVFKGVATRRWDEPEKDRPMDERVSPPEPVEMTPELNAVVQEMMDRHYMQWIDMPLPVLGGKTPRQACRSEAGRQEVMMLIRTMPDPMGRGTVQAPREAMLRELGLTTQNPTRPAAGEPVPPIPIPRAATGPGPQVPRNAPCPCGSGRKYKKCCGRQPG